MLCVCLKHQSLFRKLNDPWALLRLFFLFGCFCVGFWVLLCGIFFFLSPKVSCPRKQTQLSPNHLWFSNKERWQAKLGLLFSYYHKQSAKPQHSTACFFGCFKMACDRKQSLYVTVYLSTSAVGFNKCCLSLYSLAGLFWGIAHHCEIWKFKRRNHEREYLISLL